MRGRTFLAIWIAALPAVLAVAALSPSGLAGAAPPGAADWARSARLLGNSLGVAAGAMLLAMGWMLLPAMAAARWFGPRGGRAVAALAAGPLLVSPVVVAAAAGHLATGLPTMSFPYSLGGAAFVLAWSYGGIAFLAWLTAFRRTEAGLEECARLEMSPVAAAWRVLVPASLPIAAPGAAFLLLLGLTDFSVPESLRNQPVLTVDVYMQFGVHYDARAAVVSAMVLAAGAAAGLAALGRWAGSVDFPADEEPRPAAAPRGMNALAVAMAATPGAALAGILAATCTGPEGRLGTLAATAQLCAEELLQGAWLALLSAAAAVLAGAFLGAALAGLRRPGAWRALLVLTLLVPGPIYGVGVKLALLWPPDSLPLGLAEALAGIDDSLAPLVAVLAFRHAAIAALLAEAAIRRVPQEQRDAARLEAAGWFGAWHTWGARALAVPMLAAFGIAFALGLGEAGASILLIPPGPTTLAVRLLTLMHFAPSGQVSAMGLLLLLPAAAAVAAIALWPRGTRS